VALLAQAANQTVAVEDSMDGADRRDADVASETPDEQFADLAGAPVRLLAFGGDDQAFHLDWQLVGIAHRPARAVGERHRTLLPIAVEQLVAGLAGDPEGPADLAHRLTL
jgi:hypothetical protein